MEKYLTKEQVKVILQNAPQGIEGGQVIDGLVARGYKLEGFNDQPEVKQDGVLKALAKDVAGTLVVKPIARATEAVTRTVFPESMAAKGYEEMAQESQSQNIGGIEVPAQKAFGEGGARQITGEALQTASYLFPYGKTATAIGGATGSKILGNVASGATGGYLADVGYGLSDTEQTTSEAITPGVGTAFGAAIPLAGPAIRATGRATSKVGSKIVESVIPNTVKEAKILQTYKAENPFMQRVADVLSGTEKAPTTAGKTATRTTVGQTIPGLFGTKSQIGVQAKRAEQKLWNDVISPRLKASQQAVDLDGFFNKIEEDIIANNPEVARQKSLLKALNSFREDYAGINSISLEKLQKLKEGWAEFVPEKFYKGENIAGTAKQVQALMADEARQTIYSQLGDDVKQAYFDYGNLQNLKKMGQEAMTGAKLKGGAGSFISELASQAITPVGTVGGQAIYRLGKGIEFIGNLGAKNLGEALGIQGGLKFPGDMAVDDISKTVKKAKSLPNKQGGFIKIGQDAKAPTATQTSQTASKVKSSSMSKTLPQDETIVKSIQKAKASGQSFDEWVKGQETMYHTTKIDNVKNINEKGFSGEIGDMSKASGGVMEKGVFLYPEKSSAEAFGKNFKNPSIVETNVNGKIYDANTQTKYGWENDLQTQEIAKDKNIINQLRKDGYVGVKSTELGTDAIFVFEPKSVKTRSQLKAEWDKVK